MNILLEINIMDDCSFQDNICITSLYLVRVTNSVCFAYQCDNGHIACSSCCTEMSNKCPICTLPIGKHRCKIMEKVVEAVIIPCPNAKHGCTDDEEEGENGGGTLLDLHLLDCPACYNAFTSPIFQVLSSSSPLFSL